LPLNIFTSTNDVLLITLSLITPLYFIKYIYHFEKISHTNITST
jgi:hypothetical protein